MDAPVCTVGAGPSVPKPFSRARCPGSGVRALCVVALALGVALPASGQEPLQRLERLVVPEAQQAKLLAYNVALGAAIGGIGAVLNGRAEDPWEQRLLRGSLGGAAGGAVLYTGKRMTHLMTGAGPIESGLLAIAVHEVGGSVVENAARDVALLDRLTLHTGPVRWEWEPRGGVRARAMPLNIIATLILASRYRLDVRSSLATATPIFTGSGPEPYPIFGGGDQVGFAFLNTSYLFADGADVPDLLAHELVHILQYREFMRTTALHVPLAKSLEDEGWYDTLSRYVYFDNVHVQAFGYQVVAGGARDARCYFNNWFEREAETLSENTDIAVCVAAP